MELKFTDTAWTSAGNTQAYHSIFILDPSSMHGAVVLMTGRYTHSANLAMKVINAFQPAFDKRFASIADELYSGLWVSDDEASLASTYVESGSLWIDWLVVNATDIFEVLEGSGYPENRRYGVWTTGRSDEFR